MKPSLKSIRLLLLLVAVTMGSIDVFAQDVAPTPWREWDFNNRLFEKIGRYRDNSGSINMPAAANDLSAHYPLLLSFSFTTAYIYVYLSMYVKTRE